MAGGQVHPSRIGCSVRLLRQGCIGGKNIVHSRWCYRDFGISFGGGGAVHTDLGRLRWRTRRSDRECMKGSLAKQELLVTERLRCT